MSAVTLTLFLSAASAGCPAGPVDAVPMPLVAVERTNDRLEELYRAGATFDEFYERAERRRDLWVKNYVDGSVEAEMVARVEALGRKWRLLAVAEDWCSDSVSTIPFLALLAERSSNVEMRILDSEQGREIMESHRTPDDRAATPTVLILDENYDEAGCFVERPAELQAWAIEERPQLSSSEFFSRKMDWYDEDGGASTVRQIVEALEAAEAGTPVCDALG